MGPEKIRQFLNPESRRVVNCEWNALHQAWVCVSPHEDQFNLCSYTMEAIYPNLAQSGFQELHQESL